jgi:two-component system, NarL family, sensor histidine kinase DevS
VLKHSNATRVTVRLRSDDALSIEVTDNGVGHHGSVHGHGLTNMADRVAAIGGLFSVDHNAAGGTVVQGSFPLTVEAST